MYSASPLTARARGWFKGAASRVAIVPLLLITRTRLFRVSATYTAFRFGSQATPYGELSWAAVAGPLSPWKPKAPVPAMVLITAVLTALGLPIGGTVTLTLRTWSPKVSAM